MLRRVTACAPEGNASVAGSIRWLTAPSVFAMSVATHHAVISPAFASAPETAFSGARSGILAAIPEEV
jgi:hypothetical protein